MTAIEAVRLVAALARAEIALVRKDPVAAALLAQAARDADGLTPGPAVAAAARMARDVDLSADAPAAAATRKVVQALCRVAAQDAQAALLRGAP
ncbi:MAG: hypothetical protein QOK40_2124 [Miltoncostaeaceae bacterium]|nr:hypothetical protein [Miltoncostaeaceae bacterium]